MNKTKKRIIIVIAIVIVCLLIAAAVVYFYLVYAHWALFVYPKSLEQESKTTDSANIPLDEPVPEDNPYLDKYMPVLTKVHEAEKKARSAPIDPETDYYYSGTGDLESYFDYDYYSLEFFWNPENRAYYALHDIDDNGTPELVLSVDADFVVDIWGLNDDVPVSLSIPVGRRYPYWILSSGIIFSMGSGGAAYHGYSFYRMSENGYEVERENHFSTESRNNDDEWWLVEIIQTDASGTREIDTDEFNRIMKSYIGMTVFEFGSDELLDKAEMEWRTVESLFDNLAVDFESDALVSKREALEMVLHLIYDNDETMTAFKFVDTERLWGYEGYGRYTGDEQYTTYILEFYEYSSDYEHYIFWWHEHHSYMGEFSHNVTSNFYAVNRKTGEIIPERLYTDGFEFNKAFPW